MSLGGPKPRCTPTKQNSTDTYCADNHAILSFFSRIAQIDPETSCCKFASICGHRTEHLTFDYRSRITSFEHGRPQCTAFAPNGDSHFLLLCGVKADYCFTSQSMASSRLPKMLNFLPENFSTPARMTFFRPSIPTTDAALTKGLLCCVNSFSACTNAMS